MDLLKDDDDESEEQQRQQAQQTSEPPRPTPHIFDPIARPAPLAETSSRDSIINQASRPPPQQSQQTALTTSRPVQPQPGQQQGATDLLITLVRTATKSSSVTPEDKALFDHIRTCTLGKACTFPNCEQAKEKYSHYTKCREPRCFGCSPSRLLWAKYRGYSPPELEKNFREARIDLQNAVKPAREAAHKYREAKEAGKTELLAELEQQHTKYRENYNVSKETYERRCEEIYQKWMEAMASSMSQPSSSSVYSLSNTNAPMAKPLAAPAPPSRPGGVIANAAMAPGGSSANLALAAAGEKSATTNHSKTAFAAVAQPSNVSVSATAAPVSTAPPVAVPTVKRADEILEGHTMDFVFGDGLGTMLEEVESIMELGTLVSSSRDDDWLSRRGVSDESEPSWAYYNVLTRNDIDDAQLEMLRGHKRLFSNREIEYISRAAQELITDVLADSIASAKRRMTNVKNAEIDVTTKDILGAMAARSNQLLDLAQSVADI